MSRLKFAILGCGKIAPRHAAEMKRLGELIAVCDIIPEKADQLAGEFGASAFYHPDDLFKNSKDIDVIAVCTPNGLHAEHAVAALQFGAHVLCEKPLCISIDDGKRMIEVAEKTGHKLFVVKSTRYNPAIAALKKALEENKLGKLYSFQLNCFWNRPAAYYNGSWRGTSLDGGTLFTQFSHYIDALLWLLGDIRQVKGFRKNLAHQDCILSEDTGTVALEMQSGLIGGLNWSVNSYRENMEVSLTLIAEKATIELGGGYMNEVKYQASGDFMLDIPREGTANDYGFYKGSMSNHDQVYDNLLKALSDEQHPFISASDGLKTVEAIERIYNSVSLS